MKFMLKATLIFFILITIIGLSSCATSMTPSQINNLLPALTETKFLAKDQAEKAIESGTCAYLEKGRKYAAPQGTTVKVDLKYAARGIDEWVKLDGGNAYVLTGYNWASVGDLGGTQLFVEFNTMNCNYK
jgi:hypothetical protein